MFNIKDNVSGIVYVANTVDEAVNIIKNRILDMSYEKFLRKAEKESRLAFYDRVYAFRDEHPEKVIAWGNPGFRDLSQILYNMERSLVLGNPVTVVEQDTNKEYWVVMSRKEPGIELREKIQRTYSTSYEGSKIHYRKMKQTSMLHGKLRNKAILDENVEETGYLFHPIKNAEATYRYECPSTCWKDQFHSRKQYAKHKKWHNVRKAYRALAMDGSFESLGTKHDRKIEKARKKAIDRYFEKEEVIYGIG